MCMKWQRACSSEFKLEIRPAVIFVVDLHPTLKQTNAVPTLIFLPLSHPAESPGSQPRDPNEHCAIKRFSTLKSFCPKRPGRRRAQHPREVQ